MPNRRRGSNSRGQSQVVITCIFCGQRRPRAREDIISNWLSDELGGVGVIETHHVAVYEGRKPRAWRTTSGSMATLKFPDVCVDCNGTWMSVLEEDTKPSILRLMNGEAHTVRYAERRRLAAWAQLKALTLDAWCGVQYDGVRHLPPRLSYEFYESRQPLPNTLVSLGTITPIGEPGIGLPYFRDLRNFDATPTRPRIDFVAVSFAFRRLFLQVILGAFDGEDGTLEMWFPAHEPSLLNLWPPKVDDDLTWPTKTVFTSESFIPLARLQGAGP